MTRMGERLTPREPYTQDGVTLHLGDVMDVLAQMEPESVDCIVTSPPYWSLRQYSGEQDRVWGGEPGHKHRWGKVSKNGAAVEGYTGKRKWQHGANGRGEEHAEARNRRDNPDDWTRITVSTNLCECGAWRGQYGLEPTPEMYVEHSILILAALRRVLKPTGTVWWNIGDSYSGSGRGMNSDGKTGKVGEKQATNIGANLDFHKMVDAGAIGRYWVKPPPGLKPKDLVLIPWRVGLAAQADGWWVRSDIIWAKPNPMPESVTDRPTKSHEYVLLLSKAERYYYDADAVREPYSPSTIQRINQPNFDQQTGGPKDYANGTNSNRSARKSLENLKQKATATAAIGSATRTYEGFNERWDESEAAGEISSGRNLRSVWTIPTQPSPLPHFAAFPDELAERCIKAGCPPDGTVLDPFFGTGTTGIVARQNGRKCIGIEISEDYATLAKKRLSVGVKGVQAIERGQGLML